MFWLTLAISTNKIYWNDIWLYDSVGEKSPPQDVRGLSSPHIEMKYGEMKKYLYF